jgi:hypothetical protein
MDKTFNSFMGKYRMLIWNAEDPIIKAKIETFGYTTEKIDEGKSLFAEVEVLAETQRREYAQQYKATSLLANKRQEAEDKIASLRQFAKFSLRNTPEASDILLFSVALPTTFPDWQQSVKSFYERLLEHPNWISLMTPFGITADIITQNIVAIAELKTLQEIRQREIGDAQKATLERNKKFDELKVWHNDLRDLVKILFQNSEAQYLEKLGILVRS